MAPRRQVGETLLDVRLQFLPTATQQTPVAQIEAELRPLVTNEVENGEHILPRTPPQPPTQLLQEHGGALRGAQHEHHVDGRHIHALVEQIHREQHLQRAVPQARQGGVSLRRRSLRRHRHRPHSRLLERLRHEPRMSDADTEPQCPHAFRITNLVLHRLQYHGCPHVVGGVDVCQFLGVIASTPSPGDVPQIGPVVDTEVVERRQQLLL